MTPGRRRALHSLSAAACAAAAPAAWPACADWPAWSAFRDQFIGDGARVIDKSTPDQRTVSEAQAYAMFFALAANDRAVFERLLRWTEDNLAGGDLTRRLPAWHWGRRSDDSWGVIDANPAADADLWLVHALGEAGRLWRDRRYTALSALLAERVLGEETADLPGLGRTLLPGPRGFVVGPGRWRLNPSYLPPMQLRWLVAHQGAAWQAVLASSLQVLRGGAPAGLAPDWVVYDAASRRFEWPEPRGSHDAIRVYLWLGLTHAGDPARAGLLRHFAPMAAATAGAGAPPASVDAHAGAAQGTGPAGFSAALLPFLKALGQTAELRRQRLRLDARPADAAAYYERVLGLFGQGGLDGRLRFDAQGRLLPAWTSCAASPASPR